MRAKDLAKLLKAVPGNPEVLIEIIDKDGKLMSDASFTIDEVSVGPFAILRSTETPVEETK